MSRLRFFTAALLGAALALLPLPPSQAEAKKSSSKKSSTTPKKKPTPTPAPKKKTPMATDTTATEKKNGTASTLELPLPAKITPAGKADASDEKKTTDESAPSATEKPAQDSTVKMERAPSATVEPEAIADFAAQPAKVQQLIRDALDLTRQNLTYTFGSADPAKGGMDCSGTMYYVLRAQGFDAVPRDSAGQYLWARKSGAFFPVVSKNAESVEFKELQPGDLMFWTGTYSTGRDVPISHVMLYLGREKGTKKRIMFGASDGRSYNGVQRWGVSVFDFKMPRTDSVDPEKVKVEFVGYARIPGLRGASNSDAPAVTAGAEPKTGEKDALVGEAPTKTAPEKKKTSSTESKTGSSSRKKSN